MTINEGVSIGRAVHQYNKVVSNDLQEKKVNKLERQLAPRQIERLYPQDKITLTTQSKQNGPSKVTKNSTTEYYLGSAKPRRIIDIYV